MGTKMADEQNDEKNKSGERAPAAPNVPPKTVREVVVKHLDEPPPSGKRSIHPRRPAPIVPTREERTGEQPAEDTDSKKPASE
jgi:hypothetical protein